MPASTTELCEQDTEAIIEQCLPFIKYTAYRLSRRLPPQLSADDLIHVGIIGLLEALKRFRPGTAKLKTFAEYRIKGAMLDELRAQDWVPRSLKDKASQIRKAERGLERELGRKPYDEEIAASLNISMEEYFRTQQRTKDAVVFSFEEFRDTAHPDGDLDVAECLCDLSAPSPLDLVVEANEQEQLARLIDDLPEKEKLVLSLYYWDELTMKEIGKVLGLSEGRICQIHTRVLAGLKTHLAASLLPA